MFKKITLSSLLFLFFSFSVVGQTSYQIKAQSADPTLGYVSKKHTQVKKNNLVTITATSFDGAKFVKWSGDIKEAKISKNKITIQANSNLSIKAHFLPIELSLNIKDQFNRTTKLDKLYTYGSYVEWKVKSPYYITDRVRYITLETKGKRKLTKNTDIKIKWIKQYFVEVKEGKDYKLSGFPGGWVNANRSISIGTKITREFAKFSHWNGIKQPFNKQNPIEIKIKKETTITPILELKLVKVSYVDINGKILPYKKGLFKSGSPIKWEAPSNILITDNIRINSSNSKGVSYPKKDLIINPDWYKEFKLSIFTIMNNNSYLSTVSWQKEGEKVAIKANKKIATLQFSHWTGDITKKQQYNNPLVLDPLSIPRVINAHYKKTINHSIKFSPINPNISNIFFTGASKIIQEKNDTTAVLKYLDHNNKIQIYGYFSKGTIIDFNRIAPVYINTRERYNIDPIQDIHISSSNIIKLKWKKEFLIKHKVTNLTNGRIIDSYNQWKRKKQKIKFYAHSITGKTFYNWSGDIPKSYIHREVVNLVVKEPLSVNLNYQDSPELISSQIISLLGNAEILIVKLKDWKNYGKCIKLTSKKLEVIISINLGQVLYYGLPKEKKNFLWANVIDKTLNKKLNDYTYSGQSTFLKPKIIAKLFKKDNFRLDGIRPDKITIKGNRVELIFLANKDLNIILKKIFVFGETTLYTKTLLLSNGTFKKAKYLIAPSVVSKFIKPQSVSLEGKKNTIFSSLKLKSTQEGNFIKYNINKSNNFSVGTKGKKVTIDYGKHKINILSTQRASDYYPNKNNLITLFVPKNSNKIIEITTNGSYEYINKNASSYSETIWTLE